MRRCKVCKSINDVRDDGLCSGCYDNRMAAALGFSYGKYVAQFGNNYLRSTISVTMDKICPVCGKKISNEKSNRAKYCCKSCCTKASDQRKKYRRELIKWWRT